MTKKKPRAARVRNTLKFKKEAVRLVEGSQTVAAARTLGVLDQTLFNWGKVSLLAALNAGIGQSWQFEKTWLTPRIDEISWLNFQPRKVGAAFKPI